MGRDGDPRTRTITEVLGIAIHLQSFLKALPLYSIYEDYVTLVGGVLAGCQYFADTILRLVLFVTWLLLWLSFSPHTQC